MANVWDNLTMQPHCVAESSLLRSTYMGNGIKSLVMDKDRDNGAIVGRAAVASTYKDMQVFNAKPAVAGEPVYLVLSVPSGYNTDRKYMSDERWFYNKKGEVARCYELFAEDIFTVSEIAVTPLASSGAVVGNYVTFDEATGKYIEAADVPASGICVAQIVEVVNYHNSAVDSKAYRLLVVEPSKA